MKKLLKGIFALVLAASAITCVPLQKISAESVNINDSEGWEITAYQMDSTTPSEHESGQAELLLDNDTSTFWHNNYAAGGDADGGVTNYSIVIDFNEVVTFDKIKWTGRDGNGDAASYTIYAVNTTNDTVLCSDTETWGSAIASGTADSAGTFTATPELTNATHVKINIVSSDKWGSGRELDFFRESVISTANWSGNAYFYDGTQGNTGEGSFAGLYDGTEGSMWHGAYSGHNLAANQTIESVPLNYNNYSFEVEKPSYLLINLGAYTTFNAFTWINRGAGSSYTQQLNGVVRGVNLYYNNTGSELTIPQTEGQKIDLTNWTFAKAATLEVGSNTVELDDTIYTNQVLIEITHILPNYEKKLIPCCLDFGLRYIENVEATISNVARGKTVTCGWNEYTSNDSTPSTAAPNSTSVPGRVTDGTINDSNFVMVGNDTNSTNYSAYTQIDLGAKYDLSYLKMYRYWTGNNRNYADTVITVSNDSSFATYSVIYNSDEENFHGLGNGADSDYIETSSGKEFTCPDDTIAQYIRIYTRGWYNNVDKASGTYQTNMSHIVEFQAFGVPYVEPVVPVYPDLIWDRVPVVNASTNLLDGYYDAIDGNPTDVESTYAKLVSAKVGTVKAQYEKVGSTYTIRFVSTVASLNPKKAGFTLTINGKTKDVNCSTVYETINENDGTAVTTTTPAVEFNNISSKYFTTFTLSNVPADGSVDDMSIMITPYWITKDGTTVNGVSRTMTVSEITSVE